LDGLGALYDRFHIKLQTQPIQESAGFRKMLLTDFEVQPSNYLSVTEVQQLQKEVLTVDYPEERLDQLIQLRNDFKTEGLTVTDRQWKQTMITIRSVAFMRGSKIVEEQDLEFLKYMLWSDPDHEHKATELIYERVSPDKKEALRLLDKARDVVDQLNKIQSAKDKMAETLGAMQKVKEIRVKLGELIKKRKKYAKDSKEFERYDAQVAGMGTDMATNIGWDFNTIPTATSKTK